jgi:hypothetical protein
MKKKSSSQSAFFNVRVLIGLFVFMAGVFLALLSFGTFSSVFAQTNKSQPNQQAVRPAMEQSPKETTREEMAVALLQPQVLAGYSPPACVAGSEMFTDVPASNPFCPFIEELARRGITGGCGGGKFCPGDPVSRQQMAVFLIKAQFPDVVPASLTLRGEWSFDIDSDGSGDWGAPISYPVPMPAELTVRFRDTGSLPTAECPGVDFNTPEAAPGFVCIYRRNSSGISFASGSFTGSTRFGLNVFFTTTSAGDNFANGTWGATAPAP